MLIPFVFPFAKFEVQLFVLGNAVTVLEVSVLNTPFNAKL